MTISPAHSAAARANGAQSSGPVTAEGKARSSQNARKQGFFASLNHLSFEDKQELDQLAAAFLEEHTPQTPTEHHYLHEMIDAQWRLQRIRAYSCSIQDARSASICQTPSIHTAAEAFRQLAEGGHSLALLIRYEIQFRRQFDKSLEMLRNYRLDSPAAPAPASPTPNPNEINIPKEPTATAAQESQPEDQPEDQPEAPPETPEPPQPSPTPRNAFCPCGSKQKYKRCCGRNAPPVLSRAAA